MLDDGLEPPEAIRLLIKLVKDSAKSLAEWKYFEPTIGTALVIFIISAYFVPNYLANHNLSPPVGVYVTIMGFVIAAMSLRTKPAAWEKFLWIILITMLMAAEIKDIYSTAAMEATTFQNISDGLKETKKGLDATATTLGQEDREQNTRFSATMRALQEGTSYVTGGDSFCLMTMGGLTAEHVPSGNPFIQHEGKYPLYDVDAQITTFLDSGKTIVSNLYIGDLDKGLHKQFQRITLPQADRYYADIFFTAINGSWDEELRMQFSEHQGWRDAIRVYRVREDTGKPQLIFERIDPYYPKVNGKIEIPWKAPGAKN